MTRTKTKPRINDNNAEAICPADAASHRSPRIVFTDRSIQSRVSRVLRHGQRNPSQNRRWICGSDTYSPISTRPGDLSVGLSRASTLFANVRPIGNPGDETKTFRSLCSRSRNYPHRVSLRVRATYARLAFLRLWPLVKLHDRTLENRWNLNHRSYRRERDRRIICQFLLVRVAYRFKCVFQFNARISSVKDSACKRWSTYVYERWLDFSLIIDTRDASRGRNGNACRFDRPLIDVTYENRWHDIGVHSR